MTSYVLQGSDTETEAEGLHRVGATFRGKAKASPS